MKALLLLSVIVCGMAAGLSWIGPGFHPTPLPFHIPTGWPQPVYDFKDNPLTREGVILGRKLFYDERLSKDSSISCASCHQQFAAFSTYDHPLSHGYGNTLTTRNAPSLQNLAWQKELMWDGRIPHLDLQPLAPITAVNEMGGTMEDVLLKLKRDKTYRDMFRAAFGDQGVSTQRVCKALGQFLVTLVSADSKYDKVMRGEASFILPERLGYAIFKQKCASCHTEPLFTDLSYRNTGMPLDTTLGDAGRVRVTGDKRDSMSFKVPSLRNVALTAPYGHDGRFFTLLNVFEHYRKRMTLSNYEIGQLTAFLYTLTDTTFLKDTAFAPPGYAITPNFVHRH